MADDEYARFTANGLESRSIAEMLADLGITAAGLALIDDANVAAQQTTLGLGTGDTPTFSTLRLTGNSLRFG